MMALPGHGSFNSVPILDLAFSTSCLDYRFIFWVIMAGVERYSKLLDTSAIGKWTKTALPVVMIFDRYPFALQLSIHVTV
jgi:hypothetical protein